MVVYESHYHGISGLPASVEVLAQTEAYPVQAFCPGPKRYGFQFHAEVNETVFPRMVAHHERDGFMAKPGVDDRARQTEDAVRYLAPMRTWLEGFLEKWARNEEIARSSAEIADCRPSRRGGAHEASPSTGSG
jgi:GMP synthase-like glutamine amidotransferase